MKSLALLFLMSLVLISCTQETTLDKKPTDTKPSQKEEVSPPPQNQSIKDMEDLLEEIEEKNQ